MMQSLVKRQRDGIDIREASFGCYWGRGTVERLLCNRVTVR
jgi:hypothetical protein